MKYILICSLFLFVLGAKNGLSEETEREINSKETVRHVIKKSLGSFRFDVIGTKTIFREGQPSASEITSIDKIEIYNVENKLIQTIKYDQNSAEALSEFSDINFDGYDDLFILRASGSGGDAYDIWLFNPKKRLFEKWAELSNIHIDKKKKELSETAIRSADTYDKSYFKVVNNKLVLYKTEEVYRAEEGELVTEIKVKSKGKWRTISRKVEER